jgi:hypothetical protein
MVARATDRLTVPPAGSGGTAVVTRGEFESRPVAVKMMLCLTGSKQRHSRRRCQLAAFAQVRL